MLQEMGATVLGAAGALTIIQMKADLIIDAGQLIFFTASSTLCFLVTPIDDLFTPFENVARRITELSNRMEVPIVIHEDFEINFFSGACSVETSLFLSMMVL